MSEKILVCNAVTDNAHSRVLSPMIGRAELFVSMGQVMSPGQNIGNLWRLDQRFVLKLSSESLGVITSMKSRDRFIACAYGDTILELLEAPDQKVSKIELYQKNIVENSVDAPMDGMFYLSPSPKDPPYIKVGDEIAPGQTIGLIEVMKCFYPLKYQGSHRAKVVDIKVQSACPVSLGTKLIVIDYAR